ncbi:hypothetical protein [Fodinicola acaciae]|uniref:hypothetical protein n=1 Tax=Fodinicola acaciae TaxID=2681555 RepID=UPI0013D80DDB|nr:hypothetical protein [Fodinicola acaciae]
MTEYLFPVGFPLGQAFPLDSETSTTAPVAGVRVADVFHELSPGEYLIWLSAFSRHTAASLVGVSRDRGIEDAPIVIDALLGLGLLTTVNNDDDLLPKKLASLRLVAIGIGLGNSRGSVGDWTIGDSDLNPRAVVNIDVYSVWCQSYRRTIWDACEQIAQDDRQGPLSVAQNLVDNLPVLLGAACAFLDQAP